MLRSLKKMLAENKNGEVLFQRSLLSQSWRHQDMMEAVHTVQTNCT